jgi:hypothetical protein
MGEGYEAGVLTYCTVAEPEPEAVVERTYGIRFYDLDMTDLFVCKCLSSGSKDECGLGFFSDHPTFAVYLSSREIVFISKAPG